MSSSVSAREAEFIEEVRDRDMLFFSPRDVARFLDLEKASAYNFLSRMSDKGLVERIESGKYILSEELDSRDVYELASNLVDASYLGFFSALHFHGLTDQVPQKIQVATTKRKNNEVRIQGRKIEFITVNKSQFFGYGRYSGTVASDPEKTVIDSLRLPGKTGDLSNIMELDFGQLDAEKLVDYTVRSESSAVASRLGVLLDRKELDFDREKLQNKITHYSCFDPGKPRENPVKSWKVYLNREIK